MSAIRLRKTSKGLEVRVDDETPQSDEPIEIAVLPGHSAPPTHLFLTIPEAEQLLEGLQHAIDDAKSWLGGEHWRR